MLGKNNGTCRHRIGIPLCQLALLVMGVGIFDYLDIERRGAGQAAEALEFLFTAAPLRIEPGTNSPLRSAPAPPNW